MVSATDLGGNNKSNKKANWENQPKSENQFSKFTGAAVSDSVLYQKVVTSGTNQDRKIISIVKILPSYVGIKGYANWAESIRGIKRKDKDNFTPTTVRKKDYGTIDAVGVFHWRLDTLDTVDEYNRG